MLFQPIVGSEIYDNLKKAGKLQEVDVSHLEYSKPSILPKGFESLRELKKLQKKAILEFYLRPMVLFYFILENFTFDQIKDVFRMIKKYIVDK